MPPSRAKAAILSRSLAASISHGCVRGSFASQLGIYPHLSVLLFSNLKDKKQVRRRKQQVN
jgi:hypothetical protein